MANKVSTKGLAGPANASEMTLIASCRTGDGVFSLLGYVGTPSSVAALLVSKPAKEPFVGTFGGADALRTPVNRYVSNIRAGYAEECKRIVE